MVQCYIMSLESLNGVRRMYTGPSHLQSLLRHSDCRFGVGTPPPNPQTTRGRVVGMGGIPSLTFHHRYNVRGRSFELFAGNVPTSRERETVDTVITAISLTGFRVNSCQCKVLRTGCCSENSGSVVLLSPSNSLCRLLDIKDAKRNLIVRVIENAYESCAGYNLRYCPIRGFFRRENYIRIAMKDIIILMCFFVANFIVFSTILTKMMVHMYFVLRMAAQWFRRSFISKLDTNKDVITLDPTQLFCEYSPTHTRTHKFL